MPGWERHFGKEPVAHKVPQNKVIKAVSEVSHNFCKQAVGKSHVCIVGVHKWGGHDITCWLFHYAHGEKRTETYLAPVSCIRLVVTAFCFSALATFFRLMEEWQKKKKKKSFTEWIAQVTETQNHRDLKRLLKQVPLPKQVPYCRYSTTSLGNLSSALSPLKYRSSSTC